ncbi:MAG: class I SAM-dependent RNA methyltransferase [Leptospiraceae bacterium]|nr:class I SAM-dependent RNA methyltransferase [Leptospiraceae bacterium]
MSLLYNLTIRTAFGLENVLAAELTAIGARNVQVMGRAVSCQGDRRFIYLANLALRTANRVLLPIKKFKVGSENELYNQIKKIEWERYLPSSGTLAVRTTAIRSRFKNTHFLSLKAKDAIVDRMRAVKGLRPSVDLSEPDLPVDLQIYRDECNVSLDTSGASLHKRGYRQEARLAPLNEVLAAGMVLLSGWDGRRRFIDPMCGSATLLIEAAMIAANRAPGLYRQNYSCKSWPDFEPQLWESALDQLNNQERPLQCELIGYDSSPVAIRLSAANLKTAGYFENTVLDQLPLDQQKPPSGGGVLIMNPPYGERLKKNDIESFYSMIGDVFKQRYAGYDAWLISSNLKALKKVGLRACAKIKLYNGSLECSYRHYELYQGSRE